MDNVFIEFTKSVNGIPFFTKKAEVRKILGKPDTNSIEDSPPESEVNRAMELMEVAIKEAYKKMGKDPSSFRWPDISEYESDWDTYGHVQFEYDKQEKLIAVIILAERTGSFNLNGKEYNSFKLEDFLALSDDFIKEEEGAAYVSHSLQIGIWCPNMDKKIESILFGCPGYYRKE
ncbi:MAG: hypothetical protein IKX70_02175 [Treponema sp.]|nr:hypothetical protein [Treponema sp.]